MTRITDLAEDGSAVLHKRIDKEAGQESAARRAG